MNDEPGAGVAVREDAPPETATPAEKRRLWPLLAGGVIAAVIAVTGAVHGLGGRGALIAAGCAAAAVLAGLVLWRLPHLRKHFARPRGAGRMFRSSRTARRVIGGGKGAGFLSGGKRGKLPGGGVERARRREIPDEHCPRHREAAHWRRGREGPGTEGAGGPGPRHGHGRREARGEAVPVAAGR